MEESVILAGARTPIGKFGGVFKDMKASQLGGIAIRNALDRSEIENEWVDAVVMGMVLQGGAGQIPSRQALREAGLPWEIQTETINKVCASGMRSVTLSDQMIRCQDADVIVAGGMESMSNTPYILPTARFGQRMGDGKLVDLMLHDGLWCAFHDVHMIVHGSDIAKRYNVSREEQDEWALRSHRRAMEAMQSGTFKDEIVPVAVKNRKQDILVEQDESVRSDTSIEKLASLKPAFVKDGTITAGNAPGVNDGACALVVSSKNKARDLGREPLATILGHASCGLEAKDFPITPSVAIEKLLKKHRLSVEDIDLFEINEAFSCVALVNSKLLHIDLEKVNVNGGAVAMGHPVGASGARIILTLALELKRRGGGLGVAAICSGAAQGDAILIQV